MRPWISVKLKVMNGTIHSNGLNRTTGVCNEYTGVTTNRTFPMN